MSTLVPDPEEQNNSQIVPNDNDPSDPGNRDRSSLSFQDFIDRQQKSLESTTDLDEYKKKFEIIQIALNVEGQIIDLKDKKNESARKEVNFSLQTAQEQVKFDLARMELAERQIKVDELRTKTYTRLMLSPILMVAGGVIWYVSDSYYASILIFIGLFLIISSEDPLKTITTLFKSLPLQ